MANQADRAFTRTGVTNQPSTTERRELGNSENIQSAVLCCVVVLLLAGCSGGKGSERVPQDDATVNVSLSTTDFADESTEGYEISFTVEGSWSGTNTDGSVVYLQARDDSGLLSEPASISVSSGTNFSIELNAPPSISPGNYSGTILVRACRDSLCNQPYSGVSATVGYVLNVVAPTGEWETHQRTSAHSGYLPVTLNPSRFSVAWEWSKDPDPEPIGGINAVVTGNGMVYISTDVYFGQGILYALSESDGVEDWRTSLGTMPAMNPPATSNGVVYVATTGHGDTFLWAFNAQTGSFMFKAPFEAQWPHVLAPTVYGDQVYTAGGYYGSVTYSFSNADGTRTWAHTSGGGDMYTPAVDDTYVYHHSGSTLYLVNKTTGATSFEIVDPFGFTRYSYHGAPILGGRNNVVAYAGGSFSGRASCNVEHFDQRVLSSFNIGTALYEWSTSFAYLATPAIANGVIYAARNDPMSVDAIDEATGEILWSWAPNGNGDTSFHRNLVATNNLLFVSTDRAVYALDLDTREVRWSYPQAGMLAISEGRTLYIATGARESDGNLVAVSLN